MTARPSGAAAAPSAQQTAQQTAQSSPPDLQGVVDAIDRSQAVIEFDVRGRVLRANDNFLQTMGYAAEEVLGRHHRMFCDPAYTQTSEYVEFWERLAQGAFEQGEFRRVTKDGSEVWLQATYSPVLGDDGLPCRVVKVASDVTAAKLRSFEYQGKVAAIDRSQAVVEFDVAGRIVAANDNFLAVVGYSREEVLGKHHRMFCDPAYVQSGEYTAFWEQLADGRFVAGEFRRRRKDGQEVWLQATYNPILDASGRTLRVVKFATDVTATKLQSTELQARLAAVDRAQAVIEFDLDGNVLAANDNFLRAMGYSLREVVGQHHSMFCDTDHVRSAAYRDFWLRLGKGELENGRFHRKGKFGRDVWIQATYNPVLDLDGRPVKIVKYAYDVTEQVEREHRVASSTAAMSTAVQELLAAIRDVTTRAVTAGELVTGTSTQADEGGAAMTEALAAIERIERSSAAIADIVRVMGELASQTNLLAFNASIEAARAGEHGVGFSIVAQEVRKLAERSAEAAQQISRLIAESDDRVREGAAVSQHAQEAFRRIAQGVQATQTAVEGINAATAVQREASETVDRLVRELDEAERRAAGAS